MSQSSGASVSGNMPVFNIIDQNGGKILMRAGYRYTKLRENKNGSTRWRCINWRNKCKGSLLISSENNIYEEILHTGCEPNIVKNELSLKFQQIREKVLTSQEKVPTIYNQTFAEYEDSGFSLIEKMPNLATKRSKFYKIRNKNAGVKKMFFKNVDEVEIPKPFHNFLIAEYHDDSQRIMLFCMPDMKKKISIFQHIFLDGTFRSCPQHFCELYTLLGDVNSSSTRTNVVPIMYALLSRRNKIAYKRLFQIMKKELPNFQPSKFTLDFEKAAIGALTEEFPQAQLKGCYFHFTQAVWKRGKELNLTKCSETRRTVSLCSVLPLLPVEQIKEAFQYITENAIIADERKEETSEFITYMMNQWLKSNEMIMFWNVCNELHRTNNVTEAWNGRINKLIPKKQPSLMNLLSILHQDGKRALKDLNNHGSMKQAKYISRNRWILYVLQQLENKTINVGHCLEKLRK